MKALDKYIRESIFDVDSNVENAGNAAGDPLLIELYNIFKNNKTIRTSNRATEIIDELTKKFKLHKFATHIKEYMQQQCVIAWYDDQRRSVHTGRLLPDCDRFVVIVDLHDEIYKVGATRYCKLKTPIKLAQEYAKKYDMEYVTSRLAPHGYYIKKVYSK